MHKLSIDEMKFNSNLGNIEFAKFIEIHVLAIISIVRSIHVYVPSLLLIS